MKVLWATTFSADMWDTSGKHLIDSYVATQTPHKLIAYTEGMDLPKTPNAEGKRLEGNSYLDNFLKAHKEVIPVALGGTAVEPECKCKGGPFDVHSKKHKLPCVGYWFCKNSYRWLRKVISAKLAADAHPDYDIMMWVDSDASFLKTIEPKIVMGWFRNHRGCIFLKNKRSAIETGVVGYHLKNGGRTVIDNMLKRYTSGAFRLDQRWDDCVQLERGISASKGIRCTDLATKVGERNTVIQHSPLAAYLGHDKGLHRRTGVLK